MNIHLGKIRHFDIYSDAEYSGKTKKNSSGIDDTNMQNHRMVDIRRNPWKSPSSIPVLKEDQLE